MVIRWEPAGRATEVDPVADCVGEPAVLVGADVDFLVLGVLVTPACAEELADVALVEAADEVEPGRLGTGDVEADVLCCVSDFEA
jgi:hypothetical protein